MNANLVVCKNEVYVEDVNVGQFESFHYQANNRTLGNTATLTLPLYAIGTYGVTSGRARSRMRTVFVTGEGGKSVNLIRPCAEVKVWCWYEGWNAVTGVSEEQERVLVFSGFIEHVSEGFPTKIYLQDNSFILRFGQIQKGWDGSATLQKIVNDCIPIAQKAFDEERRQKGFTRAIPKLTYSVEKKNVQAITTSLSFRNWGARSPFDTIQKLMQLLVLYGGVSRNFNVYIGAGVTESTRPEIKLDTQYNVIERDIVPIDGRFVDYDVKVTGILSNGRQHTATGGYGTSRQRESRSEFEKTYGESYRAYSPHNTVDGMQKFADKLLAMLKGERNKGKITLLLYPKVEIMDWVKYTDTVFDELSAGFYVLNYEFKADEKGYFQYLEVTDKIFAL